MVVLPFREMLASWRNGPRGTSWREVQSPATGKRQLCVSCRLVTDRQENSLEEKALGVPVDQKLSVCQEKRPMCPGLHEEECSQQAEADDPSCLRSSGGSAVSSSELPSATETRMWPWRELKPDFTASWATCSTDLPWGGGGTRGSLEVPSTLDYCVVLWYLGSRQKLSVCKWYLLSSF